jgi:hypothetical protein
VHYFSSARKTVFCPGIFFCCQHTYSAYDTPGDKMENIDIRHGSPHQRLHTVWKVWGAGRPRWWRRAIRARGVGNFGMARGNEVVGPTVGVVFGRHRLSVWSVGYGSLDLNPKMENGVMD